MGIGKAIAVSLAFSCAWAFPTAERRDGEEWEVIIVGAGPAGIITADRMSEAGKKVLLLEQGGPSYYISGGRERPAWLDGTDLSRVDVPGLYKSIFSTPNSSLLCGDKLNSYGACTLGGNTAINAALFFQPPASDFDTFFPEQWKSADVASAISKVRSVQPFTQDPSPNGIYYLQSGYEAAKKWLVDGVKYKDVEFNAVPDDKTAVWGRPEFNYEHGQRSGAVKTYLQSALARSNFKLQLNTQVTSVARDGSKATGVNALVNNQTTTFNLCPTGKVILSGGALFSPQLLMLSGIGAPADLTNLSAMGLLSSPPADWINNSAVGTGLFDNPNTFIEFTGPSLQSYVYSYDSPPPSDLALYLTNNSRSGPYSFASETSAFWNYIPHPTNSSLPPTGVQGTIDSSGFGDFTANNTITLNVYGTSGMQSVGKVSLTATGAPGPLSNFFYTDPAGLDANAVSKFIFDLFQGLPGSGLTPQNLPANATQDEIKAYITSDTAYTKGYVNHWSSSCRLGSCVDVDGRVEGMQNLHVVDASIVPPLTTNPSFGVMVAAERASELILAGTW